MDDSIRTLTVLAERLEASRLSMISEFDRRDGATIGPYTKEAGEITGTAANPTFTSPKGETRLPSSDPRDHVRNLTIDDDAA